MENTGLLVSVISKRKSYNTFILKNERVHHLQRVALTNTTVKLYSFYRNRRRVVKGRGTRQRPPF